jgi:DNA-directed RNA polymerase delta subunit
MEAYTEEDIDRARERALKAGFPKENLDRCLGIFFEDLTETNDGGEFVKLSQQTWERRAFSIAC